MMGHMKATKGHILTMAGDLVSWTSLTWIMTVALSWDVAASSQYYQQQVNVRGPPPHDFDRSGPEARPVILNPMSIFGNPKCSYGEFEGVCYGEVECLALAGNFGNFCPGLTGLCCLFYRNCGHRTSQEISYFRNSHWPIVSSPEDKCDFKIIKRDNSYCGIRIETDQKTPKNGGCSNAFLKVTGVPFKGKFPICGTRAANRYQIDMKHVDDVTLQMNFKRRINTAWSLKVTQLKCDEFQGEELPNGNIDKGRPSTTTKVPPWTSRPPTTTTANPFGSGRPTTTSTTTMNPFLTGRPSTSTHRPITITTTFRPITASPPAPPPIVVTGSPGVSGNYAQCGVQGTGRSLGLQNHSSAKEELSTQSRRKYPSEIKRKNTIPKHRPNLQEPPKNTVTTRDEPAIIDAKWAVPSLNDSLFHHYMGPRLLFSENTRITYGQTAGRSEFPWQVAMTVNGRFHCGGSIIGDFFILTAAHCVISYRHRPSAITLTLGDWDLKSTADGQAVKATPDIIRVHEGYSRTTLQNDIAVIKVKRRIDYTSRIRPICLPDIDMSLDAEIATVTGWGRNEDGLLETTLQKLSAEVLPNSVCDQRWNKNGAPNGFIAPTMLCMSAISGDSCNGDSGGPSVYRSGGFLVQVGVVSFGSGSCSDPNLPGVYTRVSSYRHWIRQQMF